MIKKIFYLGIWTDVTFTPLEDIERIVFGEWGQHT